MGPAVQQEAVGVNAVAVSQAVCEDGNLLELWISGKSSLKQIVNCISRMLCWRYKRVKDPSAYMGQAMEVLIRNDQGKVRERLLENKYRSGVVTHENGIYFLSGRNFTGVGKNNFPILLPDSPLVARIVRDNHEENHGRGIAAQVERIRRNYFVPNLSKKVTEEQEKCYLCRRLRAEPLCQKMGRVKASQFTRSQPFRHCQIDLAGPLLIRAKPKVGKSKVKTLPTKIWVLVYLCQYTRAVWLTAVEDLSAGSLCNSLNRVWSRWGKPRSLNSDNGTNLRAGSRTIGQGDAALPEDDLDAVLHSYKDVEWTFGAPHAPWEQGGAEVFVRIFKKELNVHHARYGERFLGVLEFETLVNTLATKINERGLSLRPELGENLCPNMLLFGRSGVDGLEDEMADIPLLRRPTFIKNHMMAYLAKWDAIRMAQLRENKKWQVAKDNLEQGEYVLILDKPLNHSFVIGKVLEAYEDEDGLVRKVKLSFSINGRISSAIRHVIDLSRMKLKDSVPATTLSTPGPTLNEVQDEFD